MNWCVQFGALLKKNALLKVGIRFMRDVHLSMKQDVTSFRLSALSVRGRCECHVRLRQRSFCQLLL